MTVIDDIIERQVELALMEDIGPGDITTLGCLPDGVGKGEIVAKSDGFLAGLPLVETVFTKLDPKMRLDCLIYDSQPFRRGDRIAIIEGNRRALLTGERTALNFLGHLSGIATLTSKFVDKTRESGAKILDTRKTTPGLRHLEKYAVACGGGENHRYGLYDLALVKDNHIAAAGTITAAVENLRNFLKSKEFQEQFVTEPDDIEIEVEVTSEAELKEALDCGVNRLLLDNQTPDGLKKLVDVARALRPAVLLEASGNVTLDNVAALAASGVDFISIGALTHSAPSSDFSMEFSR